MVKNVFDKKISELLSASKEVFNDCVMPNGAIVASNSSKRYSPKDAAYYKMVWPRDAMYTCIAAKILGLDIQEKFFEWCMKAEDWEKTGLFYEVYNIDGTKVRNSFQPDQTGSVLIAIHDYYRDKKNKNIECRKFEKLIRKSAEGLCKIWDKDYFTLVSKDLWEERRCFPDMKENFTYSLAICSRGLACANELIPNKKWLKVSEEMKNVLLTHFKINNNAKNDNIKNYNIKNDTVKNFYRSFGKINDERIDASLLGLMWPSELVSAKDIMMKNTVNVIEQKIVKDYGIYRYEADEYDGWMYKKNTYRKKGAGYWPLLNFWMVLYYLEINNKAKALRYYNKVLMDIKDKKYIPEQILNNSIQVGVYPLCWSHSMFIIASKRLGYI